MDRKAFIKSCRRQGYKYVEIAEVLDISKQRVEQILRPDRHKARRLVKANEFNIHSCEFPNCQKKGEAHHPDYSKPLEVIWLCPKHHKALHSSLKPKKEKVKRIRKCAGCLKELTAYKIKWCKECGKKFQNKRHRILYNTNPIRKAKQQLYNKIWKQNNPEAYKKILTKAVKAYRKRNIEKLREKKRERYHKDIEENRRKQREYYKSNIEKKRAQYRERYHKKKLADLST